MVNIKSLLTIFWAAAMLRFKFIIAFIPWFACSAFASDFTPMSEQGLQSKGSTMVSAYGASPSLVPSLIEGRADVLDSPSDCNVLYNYGLRVYKVARPGIYKLSEAGASVGAVYQLAGESESSYRAALALCDNHGRTHIMLGLLLSELSRAVEANPHLKRGLTLPEGSADWMIAANQYLFNQINLNLIGLEERNLYGKFKEHANTKTAYLKSVARYAPYVQ